MVKPSGESNGMGYKPHVVVAEPYGGCLSRPPPPSSSFIGKEAKYEKIAKLVLIWCYQAARRAVPQQAHNLFQPVITHC